MQTNRSVNDTVYKEAALAILIKWSARRFCRLRDVGDRSTLRSFGPRVKVPVTELSPLDAESPARRSNVTEFRLSGPACEKLTWEEK